MEKAYLKRQKLAQAGVSRLVLNGCLSFGSCRKKNEYPLPHTNSLDVAATMTYRTSRSSPTKPACLTGSPLRIGSQD
jgi:hypothetical protein